MAPGRIGVALVVLGAALGCTPPLGKIGDVAEEGSGDGGSTELPPASERTTVLQLDGRAVDILFVMDDSGSMGIEQSRIATAIASFADRLVGEHDMEVRLGFTTTDNGNPWCQGTSPEAGRLVLSTCRSRLSDFVFEGAEVIDVTNEACLDLCGEETLEISPLPTHLEDAPEARPWIESGVNGTNVVGVTRDQAILCAAPMGIAGCGFESTLEAMHLALERTSSPSDASYGFLRPWAKLVVVFVTDEADCSVDDAWEEIFLPDGNRVFWSDPQSPAPSSAVCWNAGVECQGSEPQIGPCTPQNYDVDGQVTDASNAVMRSLTRYIETLQAVEASKAAYRPSGSVTIEVVGGVPEGYADGTAQLRYTKGAFGDPEFELDFGVDPGCDGPEGLAVPPVRLRALAELFPAGQRTMIHSICRGTYVPVLDDLAQQIAPAPNTQSACIPECLADVDADAAGLQAQCDVIMTRGVDGQRVESLVPVCDADGFAPGGEDACYLLRTDADAVECATEGSNAKLELFVSDGVALLGEVTVEVACEQAGGGC